MRHQITTNIDQGNERDVRKLRTIVSLVMLTHKDGTVIESVSDARGVRLVANCSGAALRDLVTRLDQSSFLN